MLYKENFLAIEGVVLKDLVEIYQTPFYIYSKKSIVDKINILKDVFSSLENTFIAYSIKAESNISLLKIMIENSIGADVVSLGEIKRFMSAGGKSSDIVFSGVGKKEEDIRHALKLGIRQFNIESIPEALRINNLAKSMNVRAKYSFRVNPDIDAHTHKKITTATHGDKFGISIKTLKENINLIKSLSHIDFVGLSMHIGSQIMSADVYMDAINAIKETICYLGENDINIDTLDIGGGYGIDYNKKGNGFDFDTFKTNVIPILKDLNLNIITEPGRFIIGSAGMIITKIEYIKKEWGKTYLILDAGMHNYMRTALYEAYNEIKPLVIKNGDIMRVDIAGPICESTDFFAHDREINSVEEGDYIAILDTGAYGASMSNTYNSHTLCEQVLVSKNEHKLIRSRQTFDELIKNEVIPQVHCLDNTYKENL